MGSGTAFTESHPVLVCFLAEETAAFSGGFSELVGAGVWAWCTISCHSTYSLVLGGLTGGVGGVGET